MDLNGDGHLDILSGSYSRMESSMAGLFQVLYGQKDGKFSKAEVLKGTDGEPLIIGPKDDEKKKKGGEYEGGVDTDRICTRPFAVDWDGDGKLDLVVGNFTGTFFWFKGEGNGKFAPTALHIKSGDAVLRIPGVHSDPFVVDWDGDGALDILTGSSNGGVYWARNKAPKGKMPDLAPFEPLIKPGKHEMMSSDAILREESVTEPAHAWRIWVADVNGDGKLDILAGDSTTLRWPVKGVSDEDFKKRLADWKKEFQVAANKYSEFYQKQDEEKKAAKKEVKKDQTEEEKKEQAKKDAERKKEQQKEQQKISEEYNKVYKKRSEFMHEEMTGFIWLFVQK